MGLEEERNNEERRAPIFRFIVLGILLLTVVFSVVLFCTSCDSNSGGSKKEATVNETKAAQIYENLEYIATYKLDEEFQYQDSNDNVKLERIYCIDYDTETNQLKYVSLSERQDIVISIWISKEGCENAEDLLETLAIDNFNEENIPDYTYDIQFGLDIYDYNNWQGLPKLNLPEVNGLFNNVAYYTNYRGYVDVGYFSMTCKYRNQSIYTIVDYAYVNKYSINDIIVEKEPTIYYKEDTLLYNLLNNLFTPKSKEA